MEKPKEGDAGKRKGVKADHEVLPSQEVHGAGLPEKHRWATPEAVTHCGDGGWQRQWWEWQWQPVPRQRGRGDSAPQNPRECVKAVHALMLTRRLKPCTASTVVLINTMWRSGQSLQSMGVSFHCRAAFWSEFAAW